MDREAAEEAANLPGIAMIVVGAINILAWLAATVGSLFGILFGGIAAIIAGFATLATLPDVFSNGEVGYIVSQLAVLFQVVMAPVIQLCSGCVNVVFLIASVAVIMGGLKLRALEAPGTVKMGIYALVAGPLISLLVALIGVLVQAAPQMVSALALMDIGTAFASLFTGCCGAVGPLITNGVFLVINGAIAAWVRSTLGNDDVAAAMEETE